MSWRAIVDPSTQTAQPPRSLPPPNFWTRNSLWCYFIVLIKRVLSVFLGRLEFWQDPQFVSENVLQKHSPVRLYSTTNEALCCGLDEGKPAKRSFNSLSLNSADQIAKWRFDIFDNPDEIPNSLLIMAEENESDFEKWGEGCAVPMDWQMPLSQTKRSAEKDLPIYTNFEYPFPGRFTNLSTYISKRDNPTCVYRAKFQLPEAWCEESIADRHDLVLILHGAGPGVEVFCNGRRLGYHTDSMTEHEYFLPVDCVPRTAAKSQLLTLRIFKYCAGSYLEDQDQWWLTGIHRDVELQYRPKAACMWDMDVRASFSAARVEINCAVSLDADVTTDSAPFAVRATLYENPTSMMETVVLPVRVIPRAVEKTPLKMEMLYLGIDRRRGVAEGSMFVLPKERIEPWTAETPRLYSLVLELIRLPTERDAEQVIQVEIVRIGFRDVRQNPEKNGEFEVNGKRVVFRGVNRHEFSPHHGKVISEESMVVDILQMKRHNFNAVRCCHYPNHHRWYELCDFFGLYVIDESNIETHGFVLGGAISLLQFDSRFRDAFLSRCHAMVLRSRNHPSIVCWSLGNESGYGPNHYDCSRLIRILDDERPVLYEGGMRTGVPLLLGDGRNAVSDFIFPMYHTPSLIHSYEVESKTRGAPVVLCEYAHCMGNSGGGLHLYWDLFWRPNSVWQGGFIWDWVDQGIAHTVPISASSSSGNAGSAHQGSVSHGQSTGNLLASTPRNNLDGRSDSTNSLTATPHQQTKNRRSSTVSFLSLHKENEWCVSHERLLEISFQGRGWGFGGDFGPRSGKKDAQFCLNGVVFPDRSPKPVLFEAKYLMQPFSFVLESVERDQVEITVLVRYDPGVPLEFVWTLTPDEFGGPSSRTVDTLTGLFEADFRTEKMTTVRIDLKQIESPVLAPPSSGLLRSNSAPSLPVTNFFLHVAAKVKQPGCKWAEAGHELAYDVFDIRGSGAPDAYSRALPPNPAKLLPPPPSSTTELSQQQPFAPDMTLVDGTHQLIVRADNYDARIDMKSGALVSFRGKDAVERLGGPSLLPVFYRACIDNDLGGAEVHVKNKLLRSMISPRFWSYAGRWKLHGLDKYDEAKHWNSVEVTHMDGNTVLVVRRDKLIRVETKIQFVETGLRTQVEVEWVGENCAGLDSLPRVGTSMELASQFGRITYCGRGPFENYPDRKRGAAMGIYTQSADSFHVPYVFPSECGGRSDVKWMVLEDSYSGVSSAAAGISLTYSCVDEPEWSIDEENRLGDGPLTFKRPAGTRGAQVSVSRFKIAQLDKARHQNELSRELNEYRAQTLKVVMDTAHMGVGGDVSWLPSVHSPFKIKYFDAKSKKGEKWTYQIDLDVICKAADDDPDEQRRRASQLGILRSNRSSTMG